MAPAGPLRVALDATPLLGHRTGVGAFVAGALPVLAADPELALSAYALSLRGGGGLACHLPPGVRPLIRPAPAGALLAAWARADAPPGRWWTGVGGPAEVVHGTNFVTPPSAPAAEVVTVHDLTPFRHPEWAAPATRRFPALLRRALSRGAVVHTPSAFVAAEVADLFGLEPGRVRAVAHGLPAPITAPAGEPPVLGRYVLALGTVEPRKDLPSLVRAFDALAASDADLRLVLAGPPGWGSDALDEAVARAHHAARIVRLGWVTPAEAVALLGGAAVLAFPSLYEGFGFPPLQAMAVGVPVVASRAGALPEVLGDGAHL
ncbi:MAG: glycosyltransferase family 4 protein, partial [Acidimicrobiales bacterium]